jgi:hypothetical protein
MRDRRFLLKSIPESVVHLQKYYNESRNQNQTVKNMTEQDIELTLFDQWINLPPMVPN